MTDVHAIIAAADRHAARASYVGKLGDDDYWHPDYIAAWNEFVPPPADVHPSHDDQAYVRAMAHVVGWRSRRQWLYTGDDLKAMYVWQALNECRSEDGRFAPSIGRRVMSYVTGVGVVNGVYTRAYGFVGRLFTYADGGMSCLYPNCANCNAAWWKGDADIREWIRASMEAIDARKAHGEHATGPSRDQRKLERALAAV
jgi:hypothetical protein